MTRPGRNEPATVGALLSRSALGRRRRDGVDRDLWSLSVGERIAARAEPAELRQGVLLVRVASSIWAQELSLLGPSILERLREHGVVVDALRFGVGQVTPREPAGRKLEPRTPRPLPEGLQARVARIEDPELRRAIEEAACWALADDVEP